MVASIFLYLLFEYPFKRLIDIFLIPYLTHDDIHELVYVRRQIGAPLNHEVEQKRSHLLQVPDSLTTSEDSKTLLLKQGKPINISNMDSSDFSSHKR